MRNRIQLMLLAAAAAGLLTAVWTGLYRGGWPLPQLRSHHPIIHGPLFLCGFLGTLIGLEKAKAVERWWAYLAPGFAAVGVFTLILQSSPFAAGVAFSLASAVLTVVFGALLQRHLDAAGVVMLAGALAWLGGNGMWLSGSSIPTAVGWWLAFPILIILGERLELSRMIPKSASVLAGFFGAVATYVAGLILFFWRPDLGLRVQGVGMLLVAAWLLRHDLARRTMRSPGVHRYTALCLLAGYVWLALAGGMATIWGADLQGLRYDALLHAITLGFVFGMIFGHVPIIAPMLLGRRIAFDRLFYGPLILLLVSLVIRIGSDLAGWLPGRSWGALLNAVALLVFLATAVRGIVRGERLG